MSVTVIQALLPLILIAGTAVMVVLSIAIHRSHRLTVALALLGLFIAFISIPYAIRLAPQQVTPLLLIDRYALFYTGLLLFAGFVVIMLSYHYWQMQDVVREEYYVLLVLAVLGCAVLVAGTHFASLFLGLEILSVALYGLVAYRRDNQLGIEAGLKYLILAGASSAFILFGMALIYANLGAMQFQQIVTIVSGGMTGWVLLLAGVGMILVGIGFKLALFPFHLWTPDVYEGAPLPVAALVATISKGAVFGLLLRFFTLLPANRFLPLLIVFSVLAFTSMFAGNLLALRQRNIKRMLAYSSIANMGYLLVAFLASGPLGVTAATYYLTAYFITILAAFGVMSALSSPERDADLLPHYRGLAWQRPWLAVVMTAALFSLAGIPLTAGFVGKFFLLTAGVGTGRWLLVITLVLNSGLGLFYYLRVVREIYRLPDDNSDVLQPTAPLSRPVSLLSSLAICILALLLVWFGIYPGPLLWLIRSILP